MKGSKVWIIQGHYMSTRQSISWKRFIDYESKKTEGQPLLWFLVDWTRGPKPSRNEKTNLDGAVFHESIQLEFVVVGNTNGSHFSSFYELFHGLPCINIINIFGQVTLFRFLTTSLIGLCWLINQKKEKTLPWLHGDRFDLVER